MHEYAVSDLTPYSRYRVWQDAGGVTPAVITVEGSPVDYLEASTPGQLLGFECAQSPVWIGVSSASLTQLDPRDVAPPAPAPPAASSVGEPSWFQSPYMDVVAGGSGGLVELAALTDGVAAGTDIIVDPADVTGQTLKVVTAGTYLLGAEAQVEAVAGSRFTMYPIVNDDSVGPAYYLTGIVDTQATKSTFPVLPTMPLKLEADDTLKIHYSLDGGTDPTHATVTVYTLRVG